MAADRGVLAGGQLSPEDSLQFLSCSFKPGQGPTADLRVHPAPSPATAPPLCTAWHACGFVLVTSGLLPAHRPS